MLGWASTLPIDCNIYNFNVKGIPARAQDYCSRIVLSESYVCKVLFVRVYISNNNVKKVSGHKMY